MKMMSSRKTARRCCTDKSQPQSTGQRSADVSPRTGVVPGPGPRCWAGSPWREQHRELTAVGMRSMKANRSSARKGKAVGEGRSG